MDFWSYISAGDPNTLGSLPVISDQNKSVDTESDVHAKRLLAMISFQRDLFKVANLPNDRNITSRKNVGHVRLARSP